MHLRGSRAERAGALVHYNVEQHRVPAEWAAGSWRSCRYQDAAGAALAERTLESRMR